MAPHRDSEYGNRRHSPNRDNSDRRYSFNDSWDDFDYENERGNYGSEHSYENQYNRTPDTSYNSDYDNNYRGNRYNDDFEASNYGARGRFSSGNNSDRYRNDDLDDYFDDVFGRNEYDNENRRYTDKEKDFYKNAGYRNRDHERRYNTGSEHSINYGSRSYDSDYRDSRDRYGSGLDNDYSGRWPISQSSDRRGVARGYDNHARRDFGYVDSFYHDENHRKFSGNQQREQDSRYSSKYERSGMDNPNSYYSQSLNRNRDNETNFNSYPTSSRRSGFGSRISGATSRRNVSNFQNRSDSQNESKSEKNV